MSARTSAAAPDVMAVEKDVPDPTKFPLPITDCGFSWAMVEPGSRSPMTDLPGATRSGFSHPSNWVGPTDDQGQAYQLAGEGELLSAYAPTVIASGSSPGLVIVPAEGPALPADTMTVMPARQARSTAWSIGSIAVGPLGIAPRDRFRTSMPYCTRWSTAQLIPLTTVAIVVCPVAPATLTDTRFAPGASPGYCPPDDAPLPAIRPATKVPWPYSSLKGEWPPVRSTPPTILPAKSGRFPLIPVSRTATVTPCPVSPFAARRLAPVSSMKVPLGVDVVEKDGHDVELPVVLRKDTVPPATDDVAAAPTAAKTGDANPRPRVPAPNRVASRAGHETPKRLLSQPTPLLVRFSMVLDLSVSTFPASRNLCIQWLYERSVSRVIRRFPAIPPSMHG